MGDYLVNLKCPDSTESEVTVIKEEIEAPSSPTQTVLQGHARSPEERCDIRLRPLQTLTHNENDSGGRGSWDEERGLVPADPVPPTTAGVNSYWREWRGNCGGRSVRDRLRFALEHNNFYQDVTFIVGKSSIERISAHKLILRLGSPVLENILERLNGSGVVDVIELPEVEPFAFKHLLQFMYTDEFNANGLRCFEIMNVLQAARRFQVQDLANLCIQALKKHINDETAVALCEMGKDVEDFELRDMALSYICRNAKKVFFSSNFMELSYANLVLLIQNDDLEWDELSIFKSVLRWADDFCRRRGLEPVANNLRGALGEIVYRIRFPLMTAEQFTFEVIPLKVLTSEEQVQVYKYLCLPDTVIREQLEPTSFNCKRRTHMRVKCKDESMLVKIKNESADSPHCQMSVASTSNADLTELESEDTSSQVSSCPSTTTIPSSTISKKKRYRSPSPMGSPVYKKKHSELFGDAPPKKIKDKEKRRSVEIENMIEIDHGEIELGKFIDECNNNTRRKEIEAVKLSGVNVTDHDRLQGKKVRFPKLREFHIDINIPSLKHREVNALAGEINIEDYLFFSVKVGKKWSPTQIWALGINMSLVINGITLLRIDHAKKSVVINKVRDCPKILESLDGDCNLRSLVICQSTFPGHMDSFPVNSLETLVMLSIDQIPEFNTFVRKFKRLQELCILSTENKKVDLSTDLVSKEKLRKLAMGSTTFSTSAPVTLKYLEELFLWRCDWNSSFEDSFPSSFPNLKKVSFFLGEKKVTFKLLCKILQAKTISEIGCGFFDWSSSSNVNKNDLRIVTDVLESVGLCESDKSFVLTKNNEEEGKQWVGRKGNLDLSQEEIFKNFQFYHLYSDYALFRS